MVRIITLAHDTLWPYSNHYNLFQKQIVTTGEHAHDFKYKGLFYYHGWNFISNYIHYNCEVKIVIHF